MPNVYHTVTWIETATTVAMNLGFEGAIQHREDGERIVETLRQLAALHEQERQTHQKFVRIGLLEIPAPDSSLTNHIPAIDSAGADLVILAIREKIAKVLADRTPEEDQSYKNKEISESGDQW